mmetsp:Transcript_10861/g.27140  ORF Transcript_10861/g.27140 Transcript_10861/m.27140 type:complete len:437 (+) Transcript_10861:85-1395(+)
MQSAAARQLARRCGAGRTALVQQRSNSFIKQVMDQVKKDMEADPKLKKDWEKVQQQSKRMAERGATVEERMSEFGDRFKSASMSTSEVLSRWKDKATGSMSAASDKMNEASEQNESLKKAREFMKARSESASESSRAVFGKTKDVFGNVMDSSSKVFSWVSDADKKAEKTKQWKEGRHAMSAAAAAKAAAEEEAAAQAAAAATDKATGTAAEGAAAGQEEAARPGPAPEPESALVVSEARGSSWDRFGAGLRDMPFLSSVFENPLFDRLFGESEIAASIREMKEVDYNFHLEEFAEDMEYIVAPHIIRTYLEGDQEALEKHCGEAAFAAVNASIKARKLQKLTLDPAILAGPKELQLVSAKLNDKGPPSFIWTFQMQQVNCLRDATDEVIEGAVDDIRMVCYAMAVNRHPNIEKDLDLQYPWQISELAILWNQPCF